MKKIHPKKNIILSSRAHHSREQQQRERAYTNKKCVQFACMEWDREHQFTHLHGPFDQSKWVPIQYVMILAKNLPYLFFKNAIKLYITLIQRRPLFTWALCESEESFDNEKDVCVYVCVCVWIKSHTPLLRKNGQWQSYSSITKWLFSAFSKHLTRYSNLIGEMNKPWEWWQLKENHWFNK